MADTRAPTPLSPPLRAQHPPPVPHLSEDPFPPSSPPADVLVDADAEGSSDEEGNEEAATVAARAADSSTETSDAGTTSVTTSVTTPDLEEEVRLLRARLSAAEQRGAGNGAGGQEMAS